MLTMENEIVYKQYSQVLCGEFTYCEDCLRADNCTDKEKCDGCYYGECNNEWAKMYWVLFFRFLSR